MDSRIIIDRVITCRGDWTDDPVAKAVKHALTTPIRDQDGRSLGADDVEMIWYLLRSAVWDDWELSLECSGHH